MSTVSGKRRAAADDVRLTLIEHRIEQCADAAAALDGRPLVIDCARTFNDIRTYLHTQHKRGTCNYLLGDKRRARARGTELYSRNIKHGEQSINIVLRGGNADFGDLHTLVVDESLAVDALRHVIALLVGIEPLRRRCHVFYRAAAITSAPHAACDYAIDVYATSSDEAWAHFCYNTKLVHEFVVEQQARRSLQYMSKCALSDSEPDSDYESDDEMAESLDAAPPSVAWNAVAADAARLEQFDRAQFIHGPTVRTEDHHTIPKGTPLMLVHARILHARALLAADALGSLEDIRLNLAHEVELACNLTHKIKAAPNDPVLTNFSWRELAARAASKRVVASLPLSPYDARKHFGLGLEHAYFEASVTAAVFRHAGRTGIDDELVAELERLLEKPLDLSTDLRRTLGRSLIEKALGRSAAMYSALLSASLRASPTQLADAIASASEQCPRARRLVLDLVSFRDIIVCQHVEPARQRPELVECRTANSIVLGLEIARDLNMTAQTLGAVRSLRSQANLISVVFSVTDRRAAPMADEVASSIRAANPSLRCGSDYVLIWNVARTDKCAIIIARDEWAKISHGHVAFVRARYPQISGSRSQDNAADFVADCIYESSTDSKLLSDALQSAAAIFGVRGCERTNFSDVTAVAALRRADVLVRLSAKDDRALCRLMLGALEQGDSHKFWAIVALALTPSVGTVALLTTRQTSDLPRSAYSEPMRSMFESFYALPASVARAADAAVRENAAIGAETLDEDMWNPDDDDDELLGEMLPEARAALLAQRRGVQRPPRMLKNATFHSYWPRGKPLPAVRAGHSHDPKLFLRSLAQPSSPDIHWKLVDAALSASDLRRIAALRVCAQQAPDASLFCVPLPPRAPPAFAFDAAKLRERYTDTAVGGGGDDGVEVTLETAVRAMGAVYEVATATLRSANKSVRRDELVDRAVQLLRRRHARARKSKSTVSGLFALYRCDVVPSRAESRAAFRSAQTRRFLVGKKDPSQVRVLADADALLISGTFNNFYWAFDALAGKL